MITRRIAEQFAVLGLLLGSTAMAETRPISVGVALLHTWDSNITRTADSVSDQITLLSGSVQGKALVGRQTFIGSWQIDQIDHARLGWRDATLHQVNAAWFGELGSKVRTDVGWQRQNYLVDLADFSGRDSVVHRHVHAGLSYLIAPSVAFGVTLDDRREEHSSEVRRSLDYEDQGVTADLRYESQRGSQVRLRTSAGDRDYRTAQSETEAGLDFHYREVELAVDWVVTHKTRVGGSLGHFWREGDLADNGSFGAASIDWDLSDKTSLQLTYSSSLSPPEANQAQSVREQQLKLSANWRWSDKVRLRSEVARLNQKYAALETQNRTDTIYLLTPLLLEYQPHPQIDILVQGNWQQRESTLDGLGYEAAQFTIGGNIAF